MKFGYVCAWVHFVANDCYYISSRRCSEFEYVGVDRSLCMVLGMISPHLCGYFDFFDHFLNLIPLVCNKLMLFLLIPSPFFIF